MAEVKVAMGYVPIDIPPTKCCISPAARQMFFFVILPVSLACFGLAAYFSNHTTMKQVGAVTTFISAIYLTVKSHADRTSHTLLVPPLSVPGKNMRKWRSRCTNWMFVCSGEQNNNNI